MMVPRKKNSSGITTCSILIILLPGLIFTTIMPDPAKGDGSHRNSDSRPVVTNKTAHQREADWHFSDTSGFDTVNISTINGGAGLLMNYSLFAGGIPTIIDPAEPILYKPDIAVDSNGNIAVTYIKSYNQQTNTDIYIKLFYSNGTEKGNEIPVSGGTAWRDFPIINFDSKNNILVIWADYIDVSGGYNYRIVLAKYDDDGNRLGNAVPFFITDRQIGGLTAKIGSNDELCVVWNNGNATGTQIFAQIIDSDGNLIGNTISVSDFSPVNYRPSLAFDTNDRFVIAWEHQIISTRQIIFQRYDASGNAIGEMVQACPTPRNQTASSIAINSKNEFMISWCDDFGFLDGVHWSWSQAVHGQLFIPDGTRMGGEINLTLAEQRTYYDTDEIADDNDTFVVVSGNFFVRINHTGTILGYGAEITDVAPTYIASRVATLSNGEFAVTWTDSGYDQWNSPSSLYISIFQKGAYSTEGSITTPDFMPDFLLNWTNVTADVVLQYTLKNSFYVSYSINGGITWVSIGPNTNLTKISGTNVLIRFRVELHTKSLRTTPILYGIYLNYTINRPPSILSLIPDNILDAVRGHNINLSAVAEDPENDTIFYDWYQTSGTPVWLDKNGTPVVSFTPSQIGQYQFRLVVKDRYAKSQPAFATISVINLPPSARIWSEGIPYKKIPFAVHSEISDPEDDEIMFNWSLAISPQGTILKDSNSPDPTIIASRIGDCTIILNVSDSLGAETRLSFNFTVIGHPPIAAYSVNRTSARPGTMFEFLSVNSLDPDGDALQFLYDFGDGNRTGWVDSSNANHSYAAPGNYTTSLIVKDSDGNLSLPASIEITVIPFNHAPVASFIYIPGNLTVPFRFTSTSFDPDGTIISLAWDFGDGSNASEASVSHIYPEGGNYTVGLMVTDNEDAVSTCTTIVRINRPPIIKSFHPATDLSVQAGKTVRLSIDTIDPDSDELAVTWSLNGNPIQNGSGFDFNFSSMKPGLFNLTVDVNDGHGGIAFHTWIVTVRPVQKENLNLGDGFLPIIIVILALSVTLTVAVYYNCRMAISGDHKTYK